MSMNFQEMACKLSSNPEIAADEYSPSPGVPHQLSSNSSNSGLQHNTPGNCAGRRANQCHCPTKSPPGSCQTLETPTTTFNTEKPLATVAATQSDGYCRDHTKLKPNVICEMPGWFGFGQRAQRTEPEGPAEGLLCCRPLVHTQMTGNDRSSAITDQFSPTSYSNVDLENCIAPAHHIVLSVQGMTCTGCEKKISKCLRTLPEIFNIKTSLLLAQVEFDLRKLHSEWETIQLVKNIERTSGFSCSRMSVSEHSIDLEIQGSPLGFLNRQLPLGVSSIIPVNEETIRVVYQPKVLGARKLISDPLFSGSKLAPLPEQPLIYSGRIYLYSMLLKAVTSTVLTIPVLVMAWAPLPVEEITYGVASLVLATIVQVYIAGPWYISAFKSLVFSHILEMDLLVVLSSTTAYMYSVIAFAFMVSKRPLATKSFFETSTLLVTLIVYGRLASSFVRQRAVESINIESMQSSVATIVDPITRVEQKIDSRLLQYQDVFKVLPDSSIVTDGVVVTGRSEVDESMMTGEAILIDKRPGSFVVAGSLNHSGTLTVRLTRLPDENTIKIIGSMVDEAKSSKTRIQDMADRVATYFIPVVLLITLLIFISWIIVGTKDRKSNKDRTTICTEAMTYAIAALIVSCPCAIGLAVPMVLIVAGGVSAKHGIIFKTAQTIEIARRISHVVFDKTGTLTQGVLSVEVELYPSGNGATIGSMVLGLTSSSTHPVSRAVAKHLECLEVPEKLEKLISVAGCGVEANWGGRVVRAGNPYWLGIEEDLIVKDTIQHGNTMLCVLVDAELVAIYGLKDVLRPEAVGAIKQLRNRCIKVSIVSGDNEGSVSILAKSLEIPESCVFSRCSPSDKQEYVKHVSANPKEVVMFCGDGTNDAAALAQATIGMHIEGGTEIAQNAADAVLVRPNLGGIIILMDLSLAFYRRIVFNFAWCFIYNMGAVLLAAGAFPKVRIKPEYAGLGEIVSVLPVVMIAMQLKWSRFSQTVPDPGPIESAG